MSMRLSQWARAQLAAKILADEAGSTARDVDVLADQIAVDARDEIIWIEVQVFDVRIQLGADVVAQPFRIHADFEIAQRREARAARLRHLVARERDEAVRVHVGGHLVRRSRELQHRRPEQRVEIDDVLADEVNLLHRRVRQELLERARLAVRACLARVEVVLE